MKFKPFKSSWKTYAAVAVGFVLGIADAVGYHVPKFGKWLIGFIAGGAVADKVEAETAEAAKAMLDAVTEHDAAPAPVPPAEAAAVKAGVTAQAVREKADSDAVAAAVKKVETAPAPSNADSLARLRNHSA